MQTYKFRDAETGKVYTVRGDSPPTEAEMAQIAASASDFRQQDSFIDNAFDVAGEFAAGANRTIMSPVNAVIDGVNYLAGTDIPNTLDLPGGRGGFMDPGTARDVVRGAGGALPVAGAMVPVAARNLASVPGAVAEFTGMGTASPAIAAGRQVDASLAPASQVDMAALPSPNVERQMSLARNDSSPARVPYRTNEVGRVVEDAAQKQAQSSGLPDDLIAIVAGANPQERQNMLRMTDIMANPDPVARVNNYPRNVLGDSLEQRVNTVIRMNQEAGTNLRQVEAGLSREALSAGDMQAIADGPVAEISQMLADMRINIDPIQRTVDFSRSRLELAPKAQAKIRKLIGSLTGEPPRTAMDVHVKKQAIGELVDEWNASSPGGATGQALAVLQKSYGSLNSFLRSRYPGYAQANDAFAETVDVLNRLNKRLGSSTDIRQGDIGPQLARTSRKVLSNFNDSDEIRGLLKELDRLAVQGGTEIGDDFMRQNVFLDEAEKLFGTPVRRSLQGEMSKAEQFANAAKDRRKIVDRVTDYAADAFSQSPEERRRKQLQALRRLLMDASAQ